MENNRELQVALRTLAKIDVVYDFLKEKVNASLETAISNPSKSEIEEIAVDLILLLAEGSADKHEKIKEVNEIVRKNTSEQRGVGELAIEAYNFVNDNWTIISGTIWALRKLGYLKIEEHPKIKPILDKLKKK